MIMPSKNKMYNGKKGIGFENPSYFCKAKELRPSLYDERVIGIGYTLMFLTHSDEALEIEKFKSARENKIEFEYDYRNLNVTNKFTQTNVPTVILEKIIIDLEDEVANLLEKEKENLEIIEFLKSKSFELSENAISKSKYQSDNECKMVEKCCDNLENEKVIAPGIVRRPKHNGVVWKKKGSSNTSSVDLSPVNNSKLNKGVKQYSRKELLSCNNSHHVDTRIANACNDAMNVSYNSRLYASYDVNNLLVFYDICLWIIDSRCLKHMTGNHALLTNFVEKFLGTVFFGNNDFAMIAGYGDAVIGSLTIKKVYYFECF
ncbi:hypothetical protein Tco_1043406 [Tanacetum coccineum]|uniref:Retrovirus-related Pol polyprotein from transposon TNT 1-94-like beta-barrel domain-containing protein n=1 Tax=Tanacetum coccineum TaxID=301880 RepID=A0ABQ5GLX2_9ASTR